MSLIKEIKSRLFVGDLSGVDILVNKQQYRELKRSDSIKLFRNVEIKKWSRHYQLSTPVGRWMLQMAVDRFMQDVDNTLKLAKLMNSNNKNTIVKFRRYESKKDL